MPEPRRLPPIWVMGLTNATFGLTGGFCAVSVPQMLARQGISAGHVATATAVIISPGFWGFLLSPILDYRFSRRTYALVFGALAALAVGFTLAAHSSLHMVQVVMTLGYLAAALYQGAVGGWTGALIYKSDISRLGIWFAVAGLCAGGGMMLAVNELLQHCAPALAGALAGALVLAPMLLFAAIPSLPPGSVQAVESFGRFWAEAALLLRQRDILLTVILFALPAGAFALTNVLGATGRDFATPDHWVGVLAGAGSIAGALAGSFLLEPFAHRFRLRTLYLGVTVVGAFFTLSLLLLPRTPWTFGLAIAGENLLQAFALSSSNAIAFDIIGPGNLFASTLFTLLLAANNLPIAYMQYLDGRGYNAGGLTGCLLTDAVISGVVCLAAARPLLRPFKRMAWR